MNILIVGHASVIGSRLRERLSGENQVFTADRIPEADFFLDLNSREGNPGAFDRCPELDALIHCAASFEDDSFSGALKNETVNSAGAIRVAELAAEKGCRHLLYLSSILIYDHPENGYFGSHGLSKRHAQENLQFLCRRNGIGFTSLILSQIYDEFGKCRKHQALLYHMIDCARKNSDITIFGKKNPRRNYLFLDDVADIVEHVLGQGLQGIFHCIHPKSYTISEVAETARRTFGSSGKVVHLSEKNDIPDLYVPEMGDLYERIGYRPKTDLEEGIRLIGQHLENP